MNKVSDKSRKQLRRLLSPESIAIVGASANLEQFNGRVVKNLLRHGFPGKVFPVNPKYEEVAGLRCYPSLLDLPETPDTVFIAVGRNSVLGVMKECAEIGVSTVTIYTAGFSEVDKEGARVEEEIAQLARKAGIGVCGPNTAGYHNFGKCVHLAGIIAMEVDRLIAGVVGVVVQSGSIGGALISRATHRGIGFSHLISCGNEMDFEMSDYVDFLIDDEKTKSVAIYMEGLKNPEKFLRSAEKALSAGKPIVVCKVGRSAAGKAAAISHTGAMVGEDLVFEAAFRHLGITRVSGLEELFEVAHMFAVSPLPKGPRVGILTTSGGAGALIADGCGELGLEIPPVSDDLQKKILEKLPDFIGVHNPIDTTIAGINSFQAILDILLKERPFDILSAVVGSSAQFRHGIAVDPITRAKKEGKMEEVPLLVYFNPYSEEAHRKVAAVGLPSFHSTEGCARAAGYLSRYAEFSAGRYLEKASPPFEIPEAALEFLSRKGTLGEAGSLRLAEVFGIRTVPHCLCTDLNEAKRAAAELGYPVVLKISSPEVAHKTEHGFVVAGLENEAAFDEAFSEMQRKLAEALPGTLDGYLVQKMVAGGEEFFLGAVRDPRFGHLITVGLGGSVAEVMEDISVRLAPVSHREAGTMLNEFRGSRLLAPFRGREGLDREALVGTIVQFSRMVSVLGDVLLEADLNPVFVLPEGEGCIAADALFVIGGK